MWNTANTDRSARDALIATIPGFVTEAVGAAPTHQNSCGDRH